MSEMAICRQCPDISSGAWNECLAVFPGRRIVLERARYEDFRDVH